MGIVAEAAFVVRFIKVSSPYELGLMEKRKAVNFYNGDIAMSLSMISL